MKIINQEASKLKVIYGPAVAVDAVLLTVFQNQLKVLLIKIGKGPYKNKWALPGGLVQLEENLDEAAKIIHGQLNKPKRALAGTVNKITTGIVKVKIP